MRIQYYYSVLSTTQDKLLLSLDESLSNIILGYCTANEQYYLSMYMRFYSAKMNKALEMTYVKTDRQLIPTQGIIRLTV